MVTIVCDSCRKHIMNPIREENYYTLLHKELCRDCYKKLRLTVEDLQEAARPHSSLAGHMAQLVANLNKMTR